jgi:chromosome segregation ATPase
VTHDGESYTSKCNVGPGIDITNERYWAKTGAYNAQVEQYKNEVKDLSSQVSGFASDNAEFREKIDQFTKDNAEMKNTVAEDKARVDALAERVATAETEIDGLQATTAQHTTEIADLHAKDEDLQRQITSNDNDIAALQAKDVEQDSRLNGIDTKLKSHDASIAQNTADIAKNTKNIQDNAANIAKNAHELADHAAKLADHEGRLTAQHEEITENHQAIERLTSVTDGLRSDLTEDEAKIESNRDAIAHIQEKDVQQDGRLDKLEECCEQAKAHFTQLDTKTDNTNTALTAEIDRAKAAELANGQLIAKNAAELANHATQLADHETRISTLESDNTTNKQDIADIKAKNAAQDTAIAGNTDSITHLETDKADKTALESKADKTALGDYVTKTEFNADQKRQDDIVGDWATAHPGQTISECATSQENELAEHAASIAQLKADKVAVDGLFQTSVEFPNIDFVLPHAGVPSVTASYTVFGFITLPFLRNAETSSTASITVDSVFEARVFYFDGTTELIPYEDIKIRGQFRPGAVCLRADIPSTSIPNLTVNKPLLIHLRISVTVSTTDS